MILVSTWKVKVLSTCADLSATVVFYPEKQLLYASQHYLFTKHYGFLAQVKFCLKHAAGEEPVYVSKSAPYVVGVADDGSPLPWTFLPGDVEVSAEIIPADEDRQKQTVTERGCAVDEAAAQVCLY
jgi:hypothetical protein